MFEQSYIRIKLETSLGTVVVQGSCVKYVDAGRPARVGVVGTSEKGWWEEREIEGEGEARAI